jgi:hypothetical protein
MRRTIAVSIALAGVSLVLPSLAQVGSGKSSLQMNYVVQIGGTGGVVQGITGMPDPTGKPLLRPTAPSSAQLVLHIGDGLPRTFYQWIGSSISTRPMPQTISIRGTDNTGRVGQAAVFSNASISALAFPALDKSQHTPMVMDVTTQGLLSIEDGAKPLKPQEMTPAVPNMDWIVGAFRVTLGSLDMNQVMRIEAFQLTPGGALQLQIATQAQTTAALLALAPDGQKTVSPVPLDGHLVLNGQNGKVMADIFLQGIRVTSFAHGSRPASNGALVDIGRATLVARAATISFAEMGK